MGIHASYHATHSQPLCIGMGLLKELNGKLSFPLNQEQGAVRTGVDKRRLVSPSFHHEHTSPGGAPSLPSPRGDAVRVSPRCPVRCERLDAILTAPTIETPAQLSLVPSGQRGWGRLDDARTAGTINREQLERLIASSPVSTQTPW